MAAPSKLIPVDFSEPRGRARRNGTRSLSPDDMLVFAAVVREGGVRRGALALDIPRSTVSRQLAGLERVLGGRLVARSTRRFALTELGRSLQEQCERLEDVLRTTEDVLARTATEPSGTLRIAASPVVGEDFLPGVLADYHRQFPKVTLEVSLSVDFVDLRHGGFDLAIRNGTIQEAGDLFAVRLGSSLKGLYASRAYLKARGSPASVAQLSEHDCIVVAAKNRASWSFRSGPNAVEVPVTGALCVDSYRLARSAALDGIGIARLPEVLARAHVGSGELVPLLESVWQRTTLYAVHAAGSPAPPKIRAFVELLKVAMKRYLSPH